MDAANRECGPRRCATPPTSTSPASGNWRTVDEPPSKRTSRPFATSNARHGTVSLGARAMPIRIRGGNQWRLSYGVLGRRAPAGIVVGGRTYSPPGGGTGGVAAFIFRSLGLLEHPRPKYGGTCVGYLGVADGPTSAAGPRPRWRMRPVYATGERRGGNRPRGSAVGAGRARGPTGAAFVEHRCSFPTSEGRIP